MPTFDDMRKRIHAALQEHYGEQDLYRALQIWKKEFSQRNRFPRREFALTVSSRLKTTANYDELLESIIYAMEADIDDLPQAPSDSSLLAKDDDLSPARSFGVLLSTLGDALSVATGSELLHRVFNSLINHNFSAALASAVSRNIAVDQGLTLIRINDASGYAKVLNIVYVAACELHGPVHADQVLSDAVKSTNQTMFGKVYSASNFL